MAAIARDVRAHLRGYKVAERQSRPLAAADAIFPFFARTRRLDIGEAALQAWIKAADYASAGPDWWTQFGTIHERKMLPHFASIQLAEIREGGVYLDAGASVSPFYKVIRSTHGAGLCYRQDLNRTAGVRGDGIGSDAAAIPLPDASLDGIVAHEAWAHFEGGSAQGFLREAARLLKKGGKLCIVPVNFAERTEVVTSPGRWSTKYRMHPDLPVFDTRAKIVIDEAQMQRQVMWWRPADLAQFLSEVSGLDFELVQIVHDRKAQFALVATRL